MTTKEFRQKAREGGYSEQDLLVAVPEIWTETDWVDQLHQWRDVADAWGWSSDRQSDQRLAQIPYHIW